MLLKIKQLNLRYANQPILKNINLSLSSGIHSLIGPSGSGKTSLLRCIAGLESYQGSISGFTPKELAYIEQPMTLFSHFTIAQNIAYPLRLRHIPATEIAARVETMLTQCQLVTLAHRYPHQLSGGEQRRVMLARSLIYQPKLLLCDEPFAAVDALTRVALVQWLKKLIQESSITVLYVTHDIPEAQFISQDCTILEDGRLVAGGTWDNLVHPLLKVHF